MLDRYSTYRTLEVQLLSIGKFFSEYFRHAMNRTGMDEKLDFSMLELKGLSAFVDFRGEYSISELSRHAHLPLPNMTFIIKRLEAKGIVKRSRDTKDKRVVKARLTTKGRKLFERFIRRRVEEFENTLGRLSEQDRTELVDVLNRASAIMQKLKTT